MITFLVLGSLLLIFAGMPIAFALVVAATTAVVWQGQLPLTVVPQAMVRGLESFPLLAVPSFILAGEIMARGGLSLRLVAFSNALVGPVRGGIGIGAVFASMIFAGVSGSGAADTAAIGAVAIPLMIRKGYPPGMAAALQASAGTVGPIIPPSIIMIIYSSITGLSVGALFLAGVVPGLVMGISLMAACYVLSWMPGYEGLKAESAFSFAEVRRTFIDALPAILMPVLILGGILGGIFTATEAGVIAALYGLAVSFLMYRDLKVSDLKEIFVRSAMISAMAMFILSCAHIFSLLLAREQFPILLQQALLSVTESPAMILLLISGSLILIGCFMEVLAVGIILIPALYEIAALFGFDQIHMAMVVIVALMIGTVTPPIGIHVFITAAIARIPPAEVNRFLLVMIVPMLVALLLVAFAPDLVLYLPRQYGY